MILEQAGDVLLIAWRRDRYDSARLRHLGSGRQHSRTTKAVSYQYFRRGAFLAKGTRGCDVVEANLELVEGESRDVKLTFRPLAPSPVPVAATPIASEAPPAPVERVDPE